MGQPFASFRTPLAANFRYDGWAETFTAKPADGLRDLYASAGWGWPNVGAFKAVSMQAVWHRFGSDRMVRHSGNEIDLLAQAKLGRTVASVRYADYRADVFATGTRKFWLQLALDTADRLLEYARELRVRLFTVTGYCSR